MKKAEAKTNTIIAKKAYKIWLKRCTEHARIAELGQKYSGKAEIQRNVNTCDSKKRRREGDLS